MNINYITSYQHWPLLVEAITKHLTQQGTYVAQISEITLYYDLIIHYTCMHI